MTTSFIRFSLSGLVTLSLVAGCGQSGEVWSTKKDSVFDSGPPRLNVAVFPLPHELDSASEQATRAAAIELLEQASLSSDPLLRANAIEAMHHAPEELGPFVRRGLADENRGVRFIAAMTLGTFKLVDLAHLAYPLLHDESPSVQAAGIFALHQCGEQVNVNPLADMLRSSNPEVKANAAIVLGELGNRSAAPMLRDAVGRGMTRVSSARAQVVDLQLAEAMVKLGDDRQLEVIRATLFAPPAEQGELVALACQMAGRLGDVRALPNLMQLATREGDRRLPAEIRMAAAMAISQIEPSEGPVSVPLEYIRSGQSELRAQAALTLGAMPDPQAASALRRLIADDNPMVQVFAASGLLQQSTSRGLAWGDRHGNRAGD